LCYIVIGNVWYYEHCTYLFLFMCISSCAALAECLWMLDAFLSMLNVMSSDIVDHECRAGYAWLLFPC
jgi:hypothetical protein